MDKIINEEKWWNEQISKLESVDAKDVEKKKTEITEVRKWAHGISMEELVKEIEMIRQRYKMETRNLFHLYLLMDALNARTWAVNKQMKDYEKLRKE